MMMLVRAVVLLAAIIGVLAQTGILDTDSKLLVCASMPRTPTPTLPVRLCSKYGSVDSVEQARMLNMSNLVALRESLELLPPPGGDPPRIACAVSHAVGYGCWRHIDDHINIMCDCSGNIDSIHIKQGSVVKSVVPDALRDEPFRSTVIQLSLQGSPLGGGEISDALFGLRQLVGFSINTQLKGTLPSPDSFLDSTIFPQLHFITLNGAVRGALPSVPPGRSPPPLFLLALANTALAGAVPSSWQRLSVLRRLTLTDDACVRGAIPAALVPSEGATVRNTQISAVPDSWTGAAFDVELALPSNAPLCAYEAVTASVARSRTIAPITRNNVNTSASEQTNTSNSPHSAVGSAVGSDVGSAPALLSLEPAAPAWPLALALLGAGACCALAGALLYLFVSRSNSESNSKSNSKSNSNSHSDSHSDLDAESDAYITPPAPGQLYGALDSGNYGPAPSSLSGHDYDVVPESAYAIDRGSSQYDRATDSLFA